MAARRSFAVAAFAVIAPRRARTAGRLHSDCRVGGCRLGIAAGGVAGIAVWLERDFVATSQNLGVFWIDDGVLNRGDWLGLGDSNVLATQP